MLNNILVRLAIYYLSWLGFLAGAFHFFPRMRFYVAQERDRFFIGTLSDAGADVSALLGDIQEGLGSFADQEGVNLLIDPSHTVPVVVALTLAFGVTLPITWVYRWTRQRKKYSQSFAHTLLVIPIAIALVVFLVKGSLALAFGLAGIVAAVRFRASLNEPMDAVYMLMAIGIGLAAGTQLTTVAYLASLIFVVITLAVWKSNFGAKPAVLSGWRLVPPDELEAAPEAGGKAKAK
ncbi:MAG: DUF4956 domain-containing protein [Acidobacteriota bacterium]|nr:DUF4956 domain-containing protein [Acidobacteriota bacterium]